MTEFTFNDDLIIAAIDEDFSERGDITSEATCQSGRQASAKIIAKAEGIIAGLPVAQRVFQLVNTQIRFDSQVYEGGLRSKPSILLQRL